MRKLSLLAILLLSFNAQAASLWCKGKVKNMYIDAGNNLIINADWRNDYTRICNTEGGRIGTVTCSLWASVITTSMVNDKDIMLMYSNPDGNLECGSIPSYGEAPYPEYVMLIKNP